MEHNQQTAQLFRPEKPQDWEDRKKIITQLYWAEDRELPEVIELMKEQYQFSATYVPSLLPDDLVD